MDTAQITPYRFLGGYVQNRNVGRVIAQFEDFALDGSKSSVLMMWNKTRGQWHHFNLGWTAIALHVSKTGMMALSADGLLFSADASGTREEKIDETDQGPAHRGPLADMRLIGDHLYAVGANRQVYRRDNQGDWSRADGGVLAPVDSKDEVGFLSIHGLDESLVIAVGSGGEIWRLSGDDWTQDPSPTSNNLHCVRVLHPTLAYACGENGTLLKWDGTAWSAVEQNATAQGIWGIQEFHGVLYLASDEGLWTLNNDGELSGVHTVPGVLPAYRNLHAADGMLWSIAPKHVLWTEDGKRWREITPGATAMETSDEEAQAGSCGCGQDHANPGHIAGAMPTGGGQKV